MLGRAVARIRVLVADSSRIHTQLLSDALERDPSLNVVHWDCHPASVIPTIMAHNVDVLAVSSSMNGDSVQGLEFVRELRTVSPTTKAVVLLDSQKDDLVVNAFRAGARGLFSKDGSIEMFCRCIHTVFEGEIWADRRSIALAVNELASIPVVRAVGANGLNLLSKRELEVVQCVVQGLTNKEIADRLKLSQHTVKNYLFRVFDKLGVSSRAELLFMTLSQNGDSTDSLFMDITRVTSKGDPQDEATLKMFEKAAQQGIPAAQLALAQMYLTRCSEPDDLVNAYMWYLIASERALQSRVMFTKEMTAKQIEDAQQKASAWLVRLKKASASAEPPEVALGTSAPR